MLKKRFLKAIMLFVMVLSIQVVHAQLKTVTGVIKDDKGAPVAGATVKAKGSTEATKTADDGSFSLDVQPTTTSLIVSSIGFGEKTVRVENAGAITITHTPTELEDVTVVNIGYGLQKRKDVTGSIASVSGKVIKDLPVQSVAEALQGRIAGVDVQKSSGEPGTSAQITIRGVSSFFQAPPLYVIDGVLHVPNSAGDGPDPGANINPQDIATIDVLKDAAAVAIYGAKAAGGVIIITTKKGQGVRPTINLNTRYGVTTPKVLKLLDRDDFVRLQDMVLNPNYVHNTQTDTFPNTDWVKAIFRNGTEENYNLSIAGAAGPTGVAPIINYYLSGVYNNQKGVYLNNSSALYGFKLNTDVKVTDRIKVGEQIDAYQRSTSPVDYSVDPNSTTLSPRLNPPFRTVPTMAIYGSTPGSWGNNPAGFNGPNIVGQILTKNRNVLQNNIQANVFAEVKLPLSLTFRATLGYTQFTEQGNDYEGVLATQVDAVTAPKLFKDFVSYTNLLNAYTLAHDKSYGNHNLNVLIGYEQYQGKYNAVFANESFVLGNTYAFLPSSNTVYGIASGGYDPNPLVESEFGRINYNYSGKYFLSASIRRDADYLKFGPGDQEGYFPGVSAGWKISDESFFKKAVPLISFLKLRASYGSVGNSGIPAYKYGANYVPNYAQNFSPGGAVDLTYIQNNLANRNVHWETTEESNIGLDGELYHGKLFFSVEWYKKNTKDLLFPVPLPPSIGLPVTYPFATNVYYNNIGKSSNTGVDILLGYKNNYKEVNYSVTFTGSFNKNKVDNLYGNNNNPIFDGDNNYGTSQGAMYKQSLTYTNAGHPFGQFWGLKVLGIYKTDQQAIDRGITQFGQTPHAGDLIYQAQKGHTDVTLADDTIIGNPYPKFTYGLTLNVSWKGFDLAMLLNGVMGVDIYNGVAPYSESIWSDGNTTSKVFGASYLGNNGLTGQPRIGVLSPSGTSFSPDPNGNYTHSSSYFVENGNYLKFKNIQIGYTISPKILGKARIKGARVFVMGNNLLTITKYSGVDPELGSQNISSNGGTTTRGIDTPYKYPSTKIYTVGLDLTF